jgi:HK97 family phage prohead protease
MSTQQIDLETIDHTETAERPFLVRTFSADLIAGDGRTVDVRIVPYGEKITHDDGLGGVPRGVPYQEEWVSGVFDGQMKAANRVLANFEHQEGIGGIVGHGIALREAADGFYGSFRLHETAEGDKTLMLVREGVLDGVSLEAQPLKNVRTAGGVIQRVKAHLRAIALTRFSAYQGSKILALREETTFDEELLPIEIDPELIARCERLGIAIPEHLKAHPAEADTPSDEGTSESGTRQEESTPDE